MNNLTNLTWCGDNAAIDMGRHLSSNSEEAHLKLAEMVWQKIARDHEFTSLTSHKEAVLSHFGTWDRIFVRIIFTAGDEVKQWWCHWPPKADRDVCWEIQRIQASSSQAHLVLRGEECDFWHSNLCNIRLRYLAATDSLNSMFRMTKFINENIFNIWDANTMNFYFISMFTK